MIDIHCHILAGIDDGAKTIADSVEMARKAFQEGIDTIVATPHFNSHYQNTKHSIIEKTEELNKVLIEEKIGVTILPGQEPRIFGEIIDGYEMDEILTLNHSQYLFVELPSGNVPRYTEKLLFDIQLKGLIPIIVHPERNQELIERPEVLYKFVEKGALTQVTASSLTGYFGKKIKNFSAQLIEANLTHFIASDAHNLTSRSFKMEEAYDLIDAKYGTDHVYLFTENAELLASAKNVMKEMPQPVKRKKFLNLF